MLSNDFSKLCLPLSREDDERFWLIFLLSWVVQAPTWTCFAGCQLCTWSMPATRIFVLSTNIGWLPWLPLQRCRSSRSAVSLTQHAAFEQLQDSVVSQENPIDSVVKVPWLTCQTDTLDLPRDPIPTHLPGLHRWEVAPNDSINSIQQFILLMEGRNPIPNHRLDGAKTRSK